MSTEWQEALDALDKLILAMAPGAAAFEPLMAARERLLAARALAKAEGRL